MIRDVNPHFDIYLQPTAKKDMAEWRIFPQFPFLLGVRVTWRQSQRARTGGRKEDLLSPLPYTLTKTGHKNFALNRSTESILSGRELATEI